jgi:hypothetical protein
MAQASFGNWGCLQAPIGITEYDANAPLWDGIAGPFIVHRMGWAFKTVEWVARTKTIIIKIVIPIIPDQDCVDSFCSFQYTIPL